MEGRQPSKLLNIGSSPIGETKGIIMSNSKTVEMLIQRKLLLMQELAEIDRALKAIEPRDTLQASDFLMNSLEKKKRERCAKKLFKRLLLKKKPRR